MSDTVKAMLVRPGAFPEMIALEKDPERGYLPAMQGAVEGLVEPFDVLFEGSPALYVNDEGIFGREPNRVIVATESMHERGYLSQFDFDHVVEAGEPYTIIWGNILAVAYGDDGELRDLNDEEIAKVCREFATRESLLSLGELFSRIVAA